MNTNKRELDLLSIGPYLESHVKGFSKLMGAEKFTDGQSNPTYLLTAHSGRYVLRRQPTGELLKSAHAVDREFRVISALQSTAVPVPKGLHLCEDKAVLGSLFYVMSFEPGRVFWNPSLPELDNRERANVFKNMNQVLATLHDVDVHKAGLEDFGKPGNYFERQVGRWTRQYLASQTDNIDAMDQLIRWLPDNIPVDDGKVSLIHGDYRIDNIIFNQQGTDVRALLDWELSTLGHPYSDLAYQCMQWRLAQDSIIPGLGGVDRDALGIPCEAAYVEQYCNQRGLSDIPDWTFYPVFSFFRLAAILQGVLKRAKDGNASNEKAFQYGMMAPELAAMAVGLLE